MHELGITQGILDRAREVGLANGAGRVTDLYIALTPIADFTEDAIEMYFEMLAGEDDYFRGARLHFERRSVEAVCMECRTPFLARTRGECCPACGSLSVQLDRSAPMVQLTDIGVCDEPE